MASRYRRNFLAAVIARLDFATPIYAIRDELPTTLAASVTHHFPIGGLQEAGNEAEVTFGPGLLPTQKLIPRREWHYWDRDKARHLALAPAFAFLELTRYGGFDDLSTPFTDITDSLYRLYPELQVQRFGLRYINHIRLPGARFAWRGFINPKLLTILQIPSDRDNIARALCVLELRRDTHWLRFQYGMHNPDFPAAIRQKLFALDFDAYDRGVLTREDICRQLPVFHAEIQTLFEDSIAPRLREVMNAE